MWKFAKEINGLKQLHENADWQIKIAVYYILRA